MILVSANDVTFNSVKKYLVNDSGRDMAKLRAILVDDKETVKELTDAAVKVVDDGDDSYRTANDDPVEDVVFRTAVKVIQADQNPAALVKFLERLERNPSAESRSQLFAWLKAEGFTITEDGFIVGYKGVSSEDNLSWYVGKEPVTVTTADGESNVITGRIPYPVGAKVTIPRELVDSDRDATCSVGIHVGTLSHARGYGDKVVLVLVDPADVVSVPRHSSGQKMRVCGLFVARLFDAESPIADAIITESNADARREYDARAENQPKRHVDTDLADEVDANDALNEDFGDTDSDEDDELIRSVAESVHEKLLESQHTKRELGKRLSKRRRTVLNEALESLLSTGWAKLDEETVIYTGIAVRVRR